MDEDSSGYGYDDEMAESGFTDNDEDDFGQDDDDDMDFGEEIKPQNKKYQVDFKVHSVDSIMKKQKEEVEHVAAFLQLKVSRCGHNREGKGVESDDLLRWNKQVASLVEFCC